jgi:hypothetical protein
LGTRVALMLETHYECPSLASSCSYNVFVVIRAAIRALWI